METPTGWLCRVCVCGCACRPRWDVALSRHSSFVWSHYVRHVRQIHFVLGGAFFVPRTTPRPARVDSPVAVAQTSVWVLSWLPVSALVSGCFGIRRASFFSCSIVVGFCDGVMCSIPAPGGRKRQRGNPLTTHDRYANSAHSPEPFVLGV